MESSEIVFNIWFFVDVDTNLCFCWKIKAYNIKGTDDEKLKVLGILAETDYETVFIKKLPDNISTVGPDKTFNGTMPLGIIQDHFEKNIDYFVNSIEEELPPQIKYQNGEGYTEKIKISMKPLFTSTVVFENKSGETRPFTSEENKEWYFKEREK